MGYRVLKILSKIVFATLNFLGNLVLLACLFSETIPYYVDRPSTKLSNPPVSAS